MGLFNFLSDRKKAKEEHQVKMQEEKQARILFDQQKAQKAAEDMRLLEIEQAKNRAIKEQEKLAEKRIALRLLESEQPLAVVSVSKIGMSSKFFNYDIPYDAEIGDTVSIDIETQDHDDLDKVRDAYVVTYGYRDIGEISESAADKITDTGEELEDVLGVISKLNLDEDPPKMSISIYRTDENGRLGARYLHTSVVGSNYSNDDGTSRQEYVRQLKVDDRLILKASKFEGKPAVEVYTEDGMQIGFLRKELSAEFCNKLKKNQVSSVSVSDISENKGKYYVDIEIEIASL